MFLAACGTPERAQQQVPTVPGSGSADCELVAIDDAGRLPACAAGTSTAKGPGRPFDTQADVAAAAERLREDLANAKAADALSNARNPVDENPVNRGFAPPPTSIKR